MSSPKTQPQPKDVKLRAFVIENNNLNQSNSELLKLLSSKLKSSIAKQRMMLLNSDDPNKEEDLISDYSINDDNYISGAILRIMDSSDIPSIPDKLFDETKIAIKELDKLGIDSSKVYKDHYYFLLDNNYIITNLQGNITITRFQTYINWLLTPERGVTMFEFTPKMVINHDISVNELKSIKVQDPISRKNNDLNNDGIGSKKIKTLSKEFILNLLKDTQSIKDIEMEKVISAELFIKFKKPKEMTKDDYQRILGAYMKPISDTDNIVFLRKKGSAIRGKEILKEKNVKIEITNSKMISEPELFLEMEKFLREIKDEELAQTSNI
jgi:hypothetical protein